MEWYWIALIILGSLLVLYIVLNIVVAYFVMQIMLEPYCRPKDEALKSLLESKRITNEEINKFQDFDIQSKYGYNLKASYIPKENDIQFADGKERVVIMVHGWTANRFSMMPYARIFLKNGFHVFFYDHRNHMESDKRITTMGDLEADDLQTVIEYVRAKMGPNIVLGTQGESMGSATVMVHAGRYHGLDFVCEDCGYSTLNDLLVFQCKVVRHIPVFPTMYFGNIWFKLRTKSNYKKVRPEVDMKSIEEIPMCFSQGDNDNFVPSYMIYRLYDAKAGFKKLYVYKGSDHAVSILDYPTEYDNNLTSFLKEAKIID